MSTEALAVRPTEAVLAPEHLQLTATQPGEIRQSQEALIDWCERKVAQLRFDHDELKASYEHAVKHKWKASTLKRHMELAGKRRDYYAKLQAALEAGYCIVPNFPVSVFAIRTERTKPLALITFDRWSQHRQKPQVLPAGDGEYRNPIPTAVQQEVEVAQSGGPMVKKTRYEADEFEAIDFPIQMAKPRIMEATSRAMALHIFDEFGILPQAKKEDPLIVGRILNPKAPSWNQDDKCVTFIIAWHLDTRSL